MRGGTNKSFGIEVAQLSGVNKDVIDRAKTILKKLEKKELNVNLKNDTSTSQNTLSETEKIILDLDVNNLSPMQAFNILADLNEKLKENNE